MAAVRCGAARTQGEATPTARVTDYDTHGAGPALVLIVGLDGDHALWRAFIPRLAERYQVLVFDHRSSGRGTGAARAFTIETLAEDTAGLLQALGLPRAQVLAVSLVRRIAPR